MLYLTNFIKRLHGLNLSVNGPSGHRLKHVGTCPGVFALPDKINDVIYYEVAPMPLWPFNSDCDIEIEDTNSVVMHDTPSQGPLQNCKISWHSVQQYRRYSWETIFWHLIWILTLDCDRVLEDTSPGIMYKTPVDVLYKTVKFREIVSSSLGDIAERRYFDTWFDFWPWSRTATGSLKIRIRELWMAHLSRSSTKPLRFANCIQ